MFAIEVEGRYPVAHCLCGFRRRFVYCLPHFFKDSLDLPWKGRDVFVNSREGLFVCHLFISFPSALNFYRTPHTESHKRQTDTGQSGVKKESLSTLARTQSGKSRLWSSLAAYLCQQRLSELLHC